MENKGPTVTLTFFINDSEQKQQARNALLADDVAASIENLYSDVFRSAMKYGTFDGNEVSQSEVDLIEKVWKKCHEHFESYKQ